MKNCVLITCIIVSNVSFCSKASKSDGCCGFLPGSVIISLSRPEELLATQAELAISNLHQGEQYYYGHNGEPNFQMARTFFNAAMNQDVNVHSKVQASLYLAYMYYYGNGIGVDMNKAMDLLSFVAQQNIDTDASVRANYFLGNVFFKHQKYMEAVSCLETAAQEDGNPIIKEHAQRLSIKSKYFLAVQYAQYRNYDAAIPLFQAISEQKLNHELRASALFELSNLFLGERLDHLRCEQRLIRKRLHEDNGVPGEVYKKRKK